MFPENLLTDPGFRTIELQGNARQDQLFLMSLNALPANYLPHLMMRLTRSLAVGLKEQSKKHDFWITTFILLAVWFALWPLTTWIAEAAQNEGRLKNTILVLSFASYLLITHQTIQLKNVFRLNNSVSFPLIVSASCLCIAYLGYLLPVLRLAIIPAYCACFLATLRFIFGSNVQRLTRSVSITIGIFLLTAMLVPRLNWPLRGLAGSWSQQLLEWMGRGTELGVVSGGGQMPMLIMLVEGQPFHVASECNGAGLIMTCLLVSLLLAIYQKLSIPDLFLNMIGGLFIGFLFNIVRIVIIILLAPSLMDHYHLMHEIIGGLTYWAALIILWILLNGPFNRSTKITTPTS